MIKYYILVSFDLVGLQRHLEIIPADEQVVIINTQDDNFCRLAEQHCQDNSIEYYVTESDGTPATGKNSVLEKFLESKNDYMVAIDGDDLLSGYGYRFYKHLSQQKSPPDMVVLYRQQQFALAPAHRQMDETGEMIGKDWKNAVMVQSFPMDKSAPDFRLMDRTYYTWYFLNVLFKDREIAERWAEDRLYFDHIMNNYSEVHEYMCRMVFHSRKCAKQMQYDNRLTIGEDTVQFLKIKTMGIEGTLDVVRHKEKEHPTYYYMKDLGLGQVGIMKNTSSNGTSWEWLRPMINVIDEFRHTCYKTRNLKEISDIPELFDGEPCGMDLVTWRTNNE